jgi:transposase
MPLPVTSQYAPPQSWEEFESLCCDLYERLWGAWANIPPKSNRSNPICFSPYLYRARNHVERFFNRIKQCRRVATRYDRLAGNYLAFVQLASIRLWLAARYESAP